MNTVTKQLDSRLRELVEEVLSLHDELDEGRDAHEPEPQRTLVPCVGA